MTIRGDLQTISDLQAMDGTEAFAAASPAAVSSVAGSRANGPISTLLIGGLLLLISP
jgi:hypothetical protein